MAIFSGRDDGRELAAPFADFTLQQILQRADASRIRIKIAEARFYGIDNRLPPLAFEAQSDGDIDIFRRIARDRLRDAKLRKNRGGMTTPHQVDWHRHDR